tara:strand:- start:965 stop:1942 length:978 start_codon:yes stop_codon:yes gene_type:complete
MYDFLGLGVLLFFIWNQPSLSSYFLSTVGLTSAIIAWHLRSVDIWFLSLGFAFLFMTFAYCYDLLHNRRLQEAYKEMKPTTPCCIPYIGCTDRASIITATCMLRSVSGLLASIACYISWLNREKFWSGDSDTIIGIWAGASGTWLASCIPHSICLIQCAAATKSETIYSFRKYVAVWLVHDTVLGVFWLYLSFMLDHLLRDDDSEWRTIFLSMISWHIIVFVIRRLYFSELWSITEHTTCCGPATRTRWGDILQLLAMFIIYGVLMHVVRDSVDMGVDVSLVILFVAALCVGYLGKLLSFFPAKLEKLEKLTGRRVFKRRATLDF